jgi:hypothetical protein
MAKMTLLEVVQEILSDMNSDNVNSINDTIEAQQVVQIAKRTYFNMVNERILPHTAGFFNLTALVEPARPTHVRIEDNVIRVESIKYDCRKELADPVDPQEIQYKLPKDFMDLVMQRNPSNDNVTTVLDVVPLFVYNNVAPSYWTSFDDKHIVFDSYNSDVDSTIQSSKCYAYGEREPVWSSIDEFVPDIPAKMFPYFVSEAKGMCFMTIKEAPHQKVEQQADRQRKWLSGEKFRAGGKRITFPNYGRK